MDRETAREWVRRWDRQQERYIADREERFTVIADVVAAVTVDNPEPLVVDLGCGPGSLSVRLAERFVKATVIGVDQDPVLLALAQAGHGDHIRFADLDLAVPGWATELPGRVDVAVSTTALHWIPPDRLPELYQEISGLLRPGGVLVNGDNLYDDQPTIKRLAAMVLEARAERVGVTDNEDWTAWWDAVTADPDLADAVSERNRRGARHGITEYSVATHTELLRAAGFSEVGTVWQSGDDVVLVAVR